MESAYNLQITNPIIVSKLQEPNNISVIEHLLDKKGQKLKKLQKLDEEGKLDKGSKVKNKELKSLFPEICNEVNEIADTWPKKLPKFGYFNLLTGRPGYWLMTKYLFSGLSIAGSTALFTTGHIGLVPWLAGSAIGETLAIRTREQHKKLKYSHYNSSTKRVILEKFPKTLLVYAAGHEYSHYLQDFKGLSKKEYGMFSEGHAHGIGRILSRKYQEKEDNEAYIYDILDTTVSDLKNVYSWLCTGTGRLKHYLLETNTKKGNYLKDLFDNKPNAYAFGNVFFSVYNALKGDKIYKQALKKDFQPW